MNKPQINLRLSDEMRDLLDKICNKEKRTRSQEVEWLVERRAKELNSEQIYITSGIGG